MTVEEIFKKSTLVSKIPDLKEYKFLWNYIETDSDSDKEYSVYQKQGKEEYVKVNLENGTLIL